MGLSCILLPTLLSTEAFVIFQMESIIIRSLLTLWLVSQGEFEGVFFPPPLSFLLLTLFPAPSPPPLFLSDLLPSSLSFSWWQSSLASRTVENQTLPGRRTTRCVTGAELPPSRTPPPPLIPSLGLCIILHHHLHYNKLTHAVGSRSIH